MTGVVPEVGNETPSERDATAVPVVDDQLVGMLVDRARAGGLQLTGEGGLLQQEAAAAADRGGRDGAVAVRQGPPARRDLRPPGRGLRRECAEVDHHHDHRLPFSSFDVEIRKVICSTNVIESVNARIRKAVRARGHFPNEQAALKRIYIYMALMSLDPTGKGRRRWMMRWKAPLNAFEIAFEGRLAAARR
jgi:hypothetical protein